jgi:hypothetical protein
LKKGGFALKKFGIFLIVIAMGASSCIIVDEHHEHGNGDIQFYWDFRLPDGSTTDSCLWANVDRMDVQIFDEFGNLEFVTDPPTSCNDGGATITDFYPGTYQIGLMGICPSGATTYEGWWDVDVFAEQVNDFGVLTLDYQGACL